MLDVKVCYADKMFLLKQLRILRLPVHYENVDLELGWYARNELMATFA